MNMQNVYEDLSKNMPSLSIKQNEDMSKHTTFKVGGKADMWIKVKTIDELKIVLKYAKENNIPFKVIHITRKEQARNVSSPITTYALFYDGEYLTNEIMNEKKFLKLINA